jgi:hypothetical protein
MLDVRGDKRTFLSFLVQGLKALRRLWVEAMEKLLCGAQFWGILMRHYFFHVDVC